MKNYYSCAELAALKLAGYPASERNMRARVVKEGWPSHKRLVSGGGMEYQPPKTILAEILKKELAAQVVEIKAVAPALVISPSNMGVVATSETKAQMTEKQSTKGHARENLIRFINQYAGSINFPL